MMTPSRDTMSAITIPEPGGAEPLTLARLDRPQPGEGQVLIKVAAAGVNRPDLLQRAGKYPPPPGASPLLGLEVAGEIVAVGPGVSEEYLDDSVCALVNGGGYAEYCVADLGCCLPVPGGLSWAEAAALPECFFTVWSNVFDRADLRSGETFLVHGGASGIGTTAIQLAHAFGARVFTTAGSAEKCARCEALGAERAINYREEDFVEELKQATNGRGVDVVLDIIGGDYIKRNLKLMATEGRLVQIAFQQGSTVTLDLMRLMLKRLHMTGATLRSRPLADKMAIASALKKQVWPLLAAGTIRPILHQTFPLSQATAAHAALETGTHFGKIVLTVEG